MYILATMTDAEVKKTRGRPKTINYETAYADKTRCPACRRITTPEDYKRLNNPERDTKTCIKCRTSILNSLAKKKPKLMKMKDKIDAYKRIIDLVPSDIINTLSTENDIKLPQ